MLTQVLIVIFQLVCIGAISSFSGVKAIREKLAARQLLVYIFLASQVSRPSVRSC